jgi:hypothetical protein
MSAWLFSGRQWGVGVGRRGAGKDRMLERVVTVCFRINYSQLLGWLTYSKIILPLVKKNI